MKMNKIILSNDDGFDSMGIVELGKKLSQVCNVITIAPSFEQSAKGHSFTLAKPLRLRRVSEDRYHLNGTPADCVYFGLHNICPEADIVISGMNHGANLGQDVYYSGTVAAAREGAMQKKKAIAISIWENGTEVDYAIAAEVAVMIIQRLLAEKWVEGTYWNVNIPHSCLELPKEEIPVVVKPLGQRRYMSNVEERNDPRGGTYFWLGGNPIPTEEDDSDAFWCEQGAIVITPLQLDCTYRSSTLLADEAMTMSDFISNDANDSSRMELVRISAGTFMMGALSNDDKASSDERPRHKVEISRDFYVGKYPVTQELWEAVMGNNPSHFKGEDRPVEKVSWFDCVEFCNKLSELENKELAYIINGENVTCNWTAKGYRLLTEGEWEYCARGGEYHLYAGSNNVDKVAWYRANSGGKTHPVGQKKPNGFGLYDMSGNVFEWCWDWFDRKVYQSRPVTGGKLTSDPRGPTSSSYRVFRGGYWSNDSDSMQASFRSYYSPTARSNSIGFRLVLPL